MKRFNNEHLKNKIMQSFDSIASFCEAAGIENPAEFEQELEQSDISAQNIGKAVNALQLLPEEIGFYFFSPDPKTIANTTPEKMGDELTAFYKELTPENKAKLLEKYEELLREQQAQGA